MTEDKILTLRELQEGDRFMHWSHRKRYRWDTFRVRGNCVFNSGHGSSTRICHNLTKREVENKSCNLKVIKL